MLIFGLHDGERITLDVQVGWTVKDVRQMIQTLLNISVDQYRHDKKVLVLSWAGADLQDPWVFSDLGIVPGSTVRVNLREEVKPVLHIHCSHSLDTISLYDNLVIGHMHLDELRSLVSRMTGLPIGIFRLVTKGGTEMYDGHRLEDYGIDVGHTILLENLDGWNEFLNLCIMGFTPQVISQVSQDEIVGRYQMKVALWVAAHFGHVDLARAMLRQGMKSSEPIGYPPQRMWCTEGGHIDSLKAPVHQAVEMGQLGVLRLFVNNDITVLTTKDGNDLAPLNIALRKKIKNCASFLLTKQWSKVSITKTFALHVGTYTHLRQWCERAKERAFLKYGPAKSSMKRRPFQPGPLVGFGVTVDGFSPSIMTGKSKAQIQKERERERKKLLPRASMPQMAINSDAAAVGANNPGDPEAYFKHMSAVQSLKSMGDKAKASRWSRVARASSRANLGLSELLTNRSQAASEAKIQRSPEPPYKGNGGGTGGGGGDGEDTVRLPPIMQKLRARLTAQSQASVVSDQPKVTTPTNATQRQPSLTSSSEAIQPPLPQPPPGEKKEDRSMITKLIKSQRGSAYFMVGGLQSQGQSQPNPTNPSQVPQQQQQSGGGGKVILQPIQKVPNLQVPSSDRSEAESQTETTVSRARGSVCGADSLDTASTGTTQPEDGAGVNLAASTNNHLPRREAASLTTTTARGNAAAAASTVPAADAPGFPAAAGKAKKKRRVSKPRVSSALLLSKAKASEGSIPLPLISHEQDRRPFFYYNGKREDDFIDPTINTWSRHTHSAGTTPRERAIRSLSVANTFKDKPWLGQVRIALQIASNPTRRNVNVRRLRSATKRTFAIK